VKTIAAALFLLALMPTAALRQDRGADQREVKGKYRVIEVDKFEIQSGVQFPAEHLADLQKEIIKQLSETKDFKQVLPPSGHLNGSGVPVLHLSGTITYSGAGGRVSLGQAGPASGHEMDAQVSFADSSTRQMIQTVEVRASLAGYSSIKDTIREFAKQTAIKTKIVLNTLIEESNAPGTPAASTSTSTPPKAVVGQVVSISAKDWPGSQQRLDQSASAGYRVAGLSRTGKYTADVKLEKTDGPGVYQYQLLHPIQASNLQKDMNEYAAKGFRVSVHTLTDLGYWTTVIMEKPPTPAMATYVYLIDESRRVSAAQKNMEKDQAQGYTMVDQSDHGALHMLLVEKIVQDKKN
jgi:hypothetical protein